MSKCISSRGEYSEHEGTGEYCDWCGDCNHARITAAAEQRGAIKALRDAAQVMQDDLAWANTQRGLLVSEHESDPGISPFQWLRSRADQIEGDDASII